ncbi:uncharacterized protein LOC126833821 [Adelges cooleyi]|uniref:uncharacterized protein LOC126833821 n=1 Tax=Adelges cooleyi TaxID=133065 RepID=UPI00218039E2|nr:uncharacterized protein LOC126833821 [Adelges cooleyi]
MSANVCFIAAVLVATAFTLASTCPTIPKPCPTIPKPCPTKPKSCLCVDVPKVYKPDYTYTDFCDLYERLPRNQCVKFFEKLEFVDILPAYNAYRDCIDDAAREAAREAYLELIKKYYSQCPDKFVLEEIIEFINSIPDECGSDGFPPGQIVYTPRGVDLLDFYESCGFTDIVADYFKLKSYEELLVKYLAWKDNVFDKNLKLSYRQCLYDSYRGQPQKIHDDVLEFHDFDNSYNPASGGFPVPRGLIPDGCGDTYDIPTYQIVYTPNGKDLHDFIESFGSSEIAFEFFISKGYFELAAKYFYWKINPSNKKLKYAYRTFLYALYKGQVPNFKPDITQDCIDFYNFDNSFKPGCGDEFPLLRSPTSSSIDIFSIFEQYTPDKYDNFFTRHNIPDLTPLYTTYQNGGGQPEKDAFLAALKTYFTPEKPDDFTQIYELIFESINGFPIDSIGCDGGPTVPRGLTIPKGPEDYLDIYYNLSPDQCIDFFTKRQAIDLIKPYQIYKNSNGPAEKEAFLEALKLYYGQKPQSLLDEDYKLLDEIINGHPLIPNGGPTVPRGLTIPKGPEDYLDIYYNLSPDQCIDFFTKRQAIDLIKPYQIYKNSNGPAEKEAFLEALKLYYGQKPQSLLDEDYKLLDEIINGHPLIPNGGPTVPRGLTIPKGPEDYLDIYINLSPDECVDFFTKRQAIDLIKPYQIYKNSNGPAEKEAFLEALKLYYGQKPQSLLDEDYKLLGEIINRHQPSSIGCDGSPTVPKFSPPNCLEDYLDIYSNIPIDQCLDFFHQREDFQPLIIPYTNFRNGGGPAEKEAFLEALKLYYGQYTQYVGEDYKLLGEIINGTPSGDSFSFTYTETKTTTTSGPSDIVVPNPGPCGPVHPKSCGCGPPPGIVIKPKC